MDTATLLAYLDTEWSELIAEAGINPETIVAMVGEHYLDDPTLAATWAQPLADYYLLRRAVRAFTPNMNIGTGGDNYALRQQYENAVQQLAKAEAKVAWIVAPDAVAGMTPQPVTIDLNFLTGGW